MGDDTIERLLVRVEAMPAHFEAQMKRINRALYGTQAQSKKTLDQINANIQRSTASIRRSVLMATSALTALGAGFGATQLIADFRAGEEAAQRLEAVLKTTGHAAGLSHREISSFARSLEEDTGRAAAEIQNAAAQLATFTSIGRNEFLEAITVANDMAAVFGGDLKSNLDAVARALDDPIEGFANLRKRGFALTEAELKRAEAHMRAGRYAEAQQVVLKNLSAQVSGAAAAVNTGLTKALNDLRRQAGDTFKQMADTRGTDAAIAALDLASKGVVFLGENMDTVLAAGEALAVFLATRYATSMALATGATVAHAAAAIRAKGAVEALTAAMARNPAGLAAVAVAALAAGLYTLTQHYNSTVMAARELDRVTSAADTAIEDYRLAVIAAKNASAEERDELLKKAEALREVTAARIADARVAAQKQADEAARAARDAQAAKARADAAWAGGGTSEGSRAAASGAEAAARGAASFAERAQKEADEAQAALARLEAAAAAAARGETLSSTTTPLEYDSSRDRKEAEAAARKAEQRRRAREDLQAEVALQEATLRLDLDRIRVLEREAAVRNRARSMVDAELVSDMAAALAEAERIQKRLDVAQREGAARAEARADRELNLEIHRLEANHERTRELERQVWLEDRIVFWQEKGYDLAAATSKVNAELAKLDAARAVDAGRRLRFAQEEHRLTVAQLSGNERLAKSLADQQEVRDRAERLRADDHGLTRERAEAMALDQVTRERLAETYGEHRSMFAQAFSEGVRAGLDGDVKTFLANQIGGVLDQVLTRTGEKVYDAIFGGVDAVVDGAAQGAAIASAVTPAVVGAGELAALSMGGAITAAGIAAGASMAQAIMAASAASAGGSGSVISAIGSALGSNFGGFRARGGPILPGKDYIVGEHRPEVFRAGVPGTIIPSVDAAAAQLGQVGRAAGRTSIVQVYANDAVLAETVKGWVQDGMRQAEANAVGAVGAGLAKKQRAARYVTRRG